MSIFRSRHFNNMEKVQEYINNPIYLRQSREGIKKIIPTQLKL